jgi:hypothetical protein
MLTVGASLLAMDVNDDAGSLNARIVWKSIVGTPPGASSLLQEIYAKKMPRTWRGIPSLYRQHTDGHPASYSEMPYINQRSI